jgi:hypothetical protein
MKRKLNTNLILSIEAVGFLSIITLSWLDELAGLPQLFFGSASTVNWHEALMETAVALLAWFVVHLLTKRLLKRLHYLEEYLRVCAWCRKIGSDEEWLPLEEYFDRHFATKTSHGMCPDCTKKFMEPADVASTSIS